MLVAVSDAPPENAFAAVNHAGKWYYIFDDDEVSKKTLALIVQINTIQAIPTQSAPWIPERSATRLREADLNIPSKLGKQGLKWRLEPEAFTRREVRREEDLLDVLVGCPVDIKVARQPST